MSKLLPHHARILIALNDCSAPYGEFCANFKHIAKAANMDDIPEVRRIVRVLARKGLSLLPASKLPSKMANIRNHEPLSYQY